MEYQVLRTVEGGGAWGLVAASLLLAAQAASLPSSLIVASCAGNLLTALVWKRISRWKVVSGVHMQSAWSVLCLRPAHRAQAPAEVQSAAAPTFGFGSGGRDGCAEL